MAIRKTFFDQFVVTAEMAKADLDEIYYDSVETNKTLRAAITRAFKLGVAEGLASAECIVAHNLKITVDKMETSDNPALRALMKLSIECYRSAIATGSNGDSDTGSQSSMATRRKTANQ